ncbi:MFS transporter [Kitasatospora sp. NPDC050543]|uniref:MFS transporter n=1 Tax=Kitasatospora sp. NPDC050543 TaxID=3364054 RepID=UPI0037B52E22
MTSWEPAPPATAGYPGRLPWPAALRHPVLAAALLALVLHGVWALFLASDAGDLAAQYAWTEFTRRNPDSAYNLSWYGGMHTASYSLLSPYLMSWLGVRTTAVLAGTLAAALAAGLLIRAPVARPLPPALWTALALWCNIGSGRVTFAVGVTFALAAVALLYPRPGPRPVARLAAVLLLAVLATTASPVAGVFLEVAAAALCLTRRRRDALVLATGPALVMAGTAVVFPFHGVQPFEWYLAVPLVATACYLALLVPAPWRTLRIGAAVYAGGIVLTWAVPSPIGSNVERLSLLFAATVVLIVLLEHTPNPFAPGARPAPRLRAFAAGAAFLALASWQVAKPVGDLLVTAPLSRTAPVTGPLIDELRRLGADRSRVEVVPLRSHREASGIAPYVNLARGWNRQVDVVRNPLFYDGTLTSDSYHAWLRHWGVGYVVLPVDRPDDAAVAEAEIVAAGHGWLSPVWQDERWRLYQVADSAPLADPPATVREAGPAAMTVDVPRAGAVLLRIPWSPWLGVEGDGERTRGCLAEAGEWTVLHASEPGTYRIGGRYGLTRGSPCLHLPPAAGPAPPAG